MVKVPLSKKYRLRITYICVVDGLRIHNLCRYCLKTSTTVCRCLSGVWPVEIYMYDWSELIIHILPRDKISIRLSAIIMRSSIILKASLKHREGRVNRLYREIIYTAATKLFQQVRGNYNIWQFYVMIIDKQTALCAIQTDNNFHPNTVASRSSR